MSIQQLIEQGINRKRAKLEDEREASERQAQKEQQEHAAAWQPILQRVEKHIPAEVAHALTTPIHPAHWENRDVWRRWRGRWEPTTTGLDCSLPKSRG